MIFDSDGSGKMNFTEMDQLIMELSQGQDPTDEEVIQLIGQFDKDDDGMVEFIEFLKVMAGRAEQEKIKRKEKEFREAFQMFDEDGSGKVSAEELREVLTNTGQLNLSQEKVEQMILQVDQDQDGMVNFDELV